MNKNRNVLKLAISLLFMTSALVGCAVGGPGPAVTVYVTQPAAESSSMPSPPAIDTTGALSDLRGQVTQGKPWYIATVALCHNARYEFSDGEVTDWDLVGKSWWKSPSAISKNYGGSKGNTART